ncbi:hypothetical protein FKM82_006406 [Ascaphus truei]
MLRLRPRCTHPHGRSGTKALARQVNNYLLYVWHQLIPYNVEGRIITLYNKENYN